MIQVVMIKGTGTRGNRVEMEITDVVVTNDGVRGVTDKGKIIWVNNDDDVLVQRGNGWLTVMRDAMVISDDDVERGMAPDLGRIEHWDFDEPESPGGIITLHYGWSFEHGCHEGVKGFDTKKEAREAVKNAWRCSCNECYRNRVLK